MTRDQLWLEYQRRKSGEADKIGDTSLAGRPGSFKDTADGWLALMLRGEDPQREQTAATILAALIDDNSMSALTRWEGDRPIIERLGSTDARMVAYAVALTDALRAELSKGRP